PAVPSPIASAATLSIEFIKCSCSERIVALGGLHGNPAQFGKGVDPGLAAESAVPRVLHAPEWHLRLVVHRRAVDMADPGVDAIRNLPRARDVAPEYRSRQAVGVVVGH